MDPLERRRPPPVRSAALSAEGPSSPQQKLLSSPILADFPTTAAELRKSAATKGSADSSIENPLVSGSVAGVSSDQFRRDTRQQQNSILDSIDLLDLVEAKRAFEQPGHSAVNGQLSEQQFVKAFSRLTPGAKPHQLSNLFMKIDCNSDGSVQWNEFLSYMMLQDKCKTQHLEQEIDQQRFVLQEPPEVAGSALHRDAIAHLHYVASTRSYVTAASDGTLRVWSGSLAHELTIQAAERASTAVTDIAVLPSALSKLAVASADRLITFYELLDHAGAQRWSVQGKMSVVDMPLCINAWTMADPQAVGVVRGAARPRRPRRREEGVLD